VDGHDLGLCELSVTRDIRDEKYVIIWIGVVFEKQFPTNLASDGVAPLIGLFIANVIGWSAALIG
jgi:hypothetical protein